MLAKNKIKISVLLSVLLILAFKLTWNTKKNTPEHIERFWVSKTHRSDNKNILVCGDSRIYRGVSTNELIRETGLDLKGANLGYSSAGFSPEYLDFVISNFKKDTNPKFLILGITPHSLTKEAYLNEHLNKFIGLSDFEIFKKLNLFMFTDFFSTQKPSAVFNTKKENYYQDYKKDGWVASAKEKASLDKTLISYQKTFSKYIVEQREVDIFLEKIKSIHQQGITIIAFRPPTSPTLQKLENTIGGLDIVALKEELIKIGVHWIAINNSDFNTYDGSHLHYNAALKLSRLLGQEIATISK